MLKLKKTITMATIIINSQNQKKIYPSSVRGQAFDFFMAAEELRQKRKIVNYEGEIIDDEPTNSPVIINYALSIELGLKALLLYENVPFDTIKNCSHNLYKLYKLTSVEMKKKLNDLYNDHEKQRLDDLWKVNEDVVENWLKHINNVFVEFRYLYEYDNLGIGLLFLFYFPKILLKYLFDLEPIYDVPRAYIRNLYNKDPNYLFGMI